MNFRILAVSFIFLFASVTFAQYAEPVEPVLIDEFGRLSHCDVGARIDNLVISMQRLSTDDSDYGIRGVLLHYRDLNELPGNANKDSGMLKTIKEYIGLRGFESLPITFVEAGHRGTETFQIFLLKPGALNPTPTNTVAKAPRLMNSTLKWYQSRIDREFGSFEKTDIIRERYLFRKDEDPDSYAQRIESLTAELAAREKSNDDWIDLTIGKFLYDNPKHTGAIIFYHDDRWFDRGKVKIEVERARNLVAESAGIKRDRIKVVDGGFRDGVVAEFWVVGAKSGFPVPTPQERPEDDDEDLSYGYSGIG